MSASPKVLRVIDGISVMIVVAAAVIALWPARTTVDATTVAALPASVSTATMASDASSDTSRDAATVVSANILSGSRKAPSSRYVSPENLASSTFALPPAFQHAGSATDTDTVDESAHGTASEDAVPALYGIISSDGTWRALVRLSTADAIPVLLREGDKRGAYRIVSIAADRVVVANGAGQRTLRLSRETHRDSVGSSLSPRLNQPVQPVIPRLNP